ncbi:hypothetical protein CGZ94_15920 [Enemella evansiae]|uniref:Uncharacterized protein n=1 Tax=Enemella evansiae TaxID=2016499 RepID=A0A255GC87_9ACTN|nr:hypothetical protein [Enemella evansiae]OYO10504.1 hypothetical protein CGZ94_15920 [Enemella evansiae]
MPVQVYYQYHQLLFRREHPTGAANLAELPRKPWFIEWAALASNEPGDDSVAWARVQLPEDSGEVTILVEDFDSDSYWGAAERDAGVLALFDPLGASALDGTGWQQVYVPEKPGEHVVRFWMGRSRPEHSGLLVVDC